MNICFPKSLLINNANERKGLFCKQRIFLSSSVGETKSRSGLKSKCVEAFNSTKPSLIEFSRAKKGCFFESPTLLCFFIVVEPKQESAKTRIVLESWNLGFLSSPAFYDAKDATKHADNLINETSISMLRSPKTFKN